MSSAHEGAKTSAEVHWLVSDMYLGAALWSVFAIVEIFYTSILSWAVHPVFFPPDDIFTLVAFLLYTVLGAILGGLFGSVGRLLSRSPEGTRNGDLLSRDVLRVTPPLAMAGYLAHVYSPGFLMLEELGLAIALLVLMKLRNTSGERRFMFVASPWLISITTLGMPWLVRDGLSSTSALTKVSVTAAFLGTVFAIAWWLAEAGSVRRPGVQTKNVFQFSMVAALVIGSAFLPDAKPLVITNAEHTDPAIGPNILLITLDTVRADHLSVYGYERDTTPTLEKLAEESTVYMRTMSTGDMTLMSHASIFTGLYPRAHGAHYVPDEAPDGRPLPGHFITLTELLAGAGYATAAVVSNSAYLNREFGMARGFQYYDDRPLEHFFSTGSEYSLRNLLREFLALFTPPAVSDPVFRPAAQINEEAFRLIDEAGTSNRPFFLFINYMDAHWPYLPPAPYDRRYPGKLDGFTSNRFYTLKERVCSLAGSINHEEQDHLVSQYDGGIAYLDMQLGKLLERLRQKDLYENTLIIITADHGEEFGRRDFIEHAMSVYADQIHVPLIIKYPNARHTGSVDGLTSGVDLLPTVLDVAGVDLAFELPGISLATAAPAADRSVFSESYQNAAYYDWHSRFRRTQRALLKGWSKAVFTNDGSRELYDLKADAGENTNILGDRTQDAVAFEQSMDEWLETVVPLTGTGSVVNTDLQERLRSLGYIR